MRTMTFVLAGALLLGVSHPALAQERPDLSGSWVLSESTGGMGARAMAGPPGEGRPQGIMMVRGGLGREVSISQTDRTIVIVQSTPRGEMRNTYNLDGSPSRNTLTFGDRQTEIVSTASWDGDSLVIVTPTPMGGAGETRMTLSLDPSGDLVVETLRPGTAADAEPVRAVYSRS